MNGRRRRTELLLYLAPVTLFYVLFLIVPYAMVLRLSFFRFSSMRLYVPEFTLANYASVVTDPFYVALMARTIGLGLLVTAITLLLGYPLALRIARAGPRLKSALLAVTLSPLLINLVVRTYAWLVLLGDTGRDQQLAAGSSGVIARAAAAQRQSSFRSWSASCTSACR